MSIEDAPQLPLTRTRLALVAAGGLMFAAHVIGAVLVAPAITGEDNTQPAVLFALWAASVPWAAAVVLLLIRQADLPDIATASMLVTIPPFGAFMLATAFHVDGTDAAVNEVDALFLGVTTGALTALVVWGVATAAARVLRLPRTAMDGDAPDP